METKKILVLTKTYPSISKKYRETVCTAGILLDDDEKPLHFIRIYPVRYRDLQFEKKFPKWGIISADIERNDKDSRWESYRIDDSSIVVLRETSREDQWEERRRFFEGLVSPSLEAIKSNNKSLGILKPSSISYLHEKSNRDWPDSQQAVLDQGDMFRSGEAFSDLEKIPYKFFYKFNDSEDKAHRCSIIDWEISQLYRKMRDKSKNSSIQEQEEDALEKVKIKLADQLIKRDLFLLMGNLKKYPNSFVIIGLIYPPHKQSKQLNLWGDT